MAVDPVSKRPGRPAAQPASIDRAVPGVTARDGMAQAVLTLWTFPPKNDTSS